MGSDTISPFAFFPLSLCWRDEAECLGRIDDADALIFFEDEQIIITRHDQVGPRGDSQGEYFIVVRVAAYWFLLGGRLDYFRQPLHLVECPLS